MSDSENEDDYWLSDQQFFSSEDWRDDFAHRMCSDDDFTDEAAWNLEDDENFEVDKDMEGLQIADMPSRNVQETQVVLEEGLWHSMPEELIGKILTWLPPAALFRFRCVCKKWKSLLASQGWLQHYSQVNSRPSCTIMCTSGALKASFFCHSEHRWFNIPFNPVEPDWELADSDAGLLCYQCNRSGGLWLCVCNPLTQSSKVVPPDYPGWDVQPSHCELLKLVVTRQAKTFKVVVLVHSSNPPTTVIYDSTTSVWTVCRSFPPQDFIAGSLFVWKNAIYFQSFQPGVLFTFGMDSGIWSEVEIGLPCRPTRRHYIISSSDRVLLVQNGNTDDEPISIWKLLDDVSSPSSSGFSSSKWAKASVSMPADLKSLLSFVNSCLCKSDCIIFTTSFTNQWVAYVFATNSWHLMPSCGQRKADYLWFDWEPRLDMDVESDSLPENEGPQI